MLQYYDKTNEFLDGAKLRWYKYDTTQKVVGWIPAPACSPSFICQGIHCAGAEFDLCCPSLTVKLWVGILFLLSCYTSMVSTILNRQKLRGFSTCLMHCAEYMHCTWCAWLHLILHMSFVNHSAWYKVTRLFSTDLGIAHRYMWEIQEPAPFFSRHGAQIGGSLGFPVIKITVVRQVRMSPASTAVWAWR